MLTKQEQLLKLHYVYMTCNSYRVLLIFTVGHLLLEIKTIHHFTVLVGKAQIETKTCFRLLFRFVLRPTSSKENTIWIAFPCYSYCV
jgi:hypothetical protein